MKAIIDIYSDSNKLIAEEEFYFEDFQDMSNQLNDKVQELISIVERDEQYFEENTEDVEEFI